MNGFTFEVASILRRFSKPLKDSQYLTFVRRFPCVSCGSSRRVEAAHIGPRGLKQRTSDFTALPICFTCHQDGAGALHKVGPEAFQRLQALDFAALQGMFNHFYFLRMGKYAHGWEAEFERRKAA